MVLCNLFPNMSFRVKKLKFQIKNVKYLVPNMLQYSEHSREKKNKMI